MNQNNFADPRAFVSQEPWGTTPEGAPVTLYTLRNANGLEARVMDFGGVLVSLKAPDRHGEFADIVLGHDTLEPYTSHDTSPYFGALIGRCANRIANGRFRLDGTMYQLALNNGPNALHGGLRGFDQVLWQSEPYGAADGAGVRLSYRSADGEEGYPGDLTVQVTYVLTHADELRVDYHATTDRPTLVNLTNHTYWNLSGNARDDILGHELRLEADFITPIDATLIPTGALLSVAGTPFDFREAHPVGARLNEDDGQLLYAGGYDHNFVLRGGADLKLAARLHDPTSGRALEVRTTQPGLQFYSGNFLDGSIVGKGGRPYGQRWGLCLETQHFPDAPNHPDFPSVVLRPGEAFTSRTVYAFTTR